MASNMRDLTRAEQSYVAQVEFQLRHEPRLRRHRMLQRLRRQLLQQVVYDGFARIEKDFGTPADYATWLTDNSDEAGFELVHAKAGRSRRA